MLQLEPGESCVIQTSAAPLKAALFPYTQTAGDLITLSGKWDIQFNQGGPVLPSPVSVASLESWTKFDIAGVKTFSGTATYTTHFQYSNTAGTDACLLDLGEVKESATVILNGKKLATLIGPGYTVTIPAAVLQPFNTLTVIVTNGMANRIIDLDKRGNLKKFYNINMSARLAENRGPDGLFTAAKWDPKASGLLGPVTLQPLKWIK
ncbi:MAG: hypothetical protein IPG86_21235 [Chitinophagaceae bacterium]|nr:hypothetical protein [Chitinophagaceae bacterium]